MTHTGWEMLAYSAGALAGLILKFINHLRAGRKLGLPISLLIDQWIFDDGSKENKVSWVATGAGVWVFGLLFVYRIGGEWLIPADFADAPLIIHASVALLLGTLAEYIVPGMIKFVLKRFSFGGQA